MQIRLQYAAGWTPRGAASAFQNGCGYVGRFDGFSSVRLHRRSGFAILPSHARGPCIRFPCCNSCSVTVDSGRHFSSGSLLGRAGRGAASEDADEFDDPELLDELTGSRDDTFSDLGSMIRKRGTGQVHRRPVSLKPVSPAEALRARQRAEAAKAFAQRQALNKLRETVRRVESGLASITPFSRLVSEFCDAKYLGLENELSRSARRISDLKSDFGRLVSEYCDAKYLGLENELSRCAQLISDLKSDYRRLKFSLEVVSIALRVSALSDAFRELVHELNEEFIRPRASARKKVDDILDSVLSLQKKYMSLQDSFRVALQKSHEVSDILQSLGSDRDIPSERRKTYYAFKDAQRWTAREVARAGHVFRRFYFLRTNLEGPLAGASYLRLISLYGNEWPRIHERSKTLRLSIEALVGGSVSRKVSRRQWTYENILLHFYMRRLRKRFPARSPRLNIFWRQLDVLAPFELLWASTGALSTEIAYLISTLANPPPGLWSNLDTKARLRHVRNLKEVHHAFDYFRGDISNEYTWLRMINWLRLQSESRIHDLGETAFTVQSGLFTPATPLSKNTALFRQWVLQMDSYVNQTLALGEVQLNHLRMWYGSSQKTSVGAEFHEEEELDDIALRQVHSELYPLGVESVSQNGDTSGTKARTRLSVRRPLKHRMATQMKPLFSFRRSAKLSARARSSKILDDAVTLVRNVPTDTTGDHGERNAKPTRSVLSSGSNRSFAQRSKRAEENSRDGSMNSLGDQRENNSEQRSDKPLNSRSNPKKRKHQTRVGKATREKVKAGSRRRVQSEEPSKNSPSRTRRAPRSADTTISKRYSRPKRTPCSSSKFSVPRVSGGPSSSAFSRQYSTGPGTHGDSSADGHSENEFSLTDFSQEASRTDHNTLNSEDLVSTGSSPDTATAVKRFTTQITSSVEKAPRPQFWSHNLCKGPGDKSIVVHYCTTLESTERVTSLFLKSDVVGFDLEWMAQTFSTDGIKNNVSLIQLANEERIALFHIALFRPGETLDELVAPSLKKLLESPDITKVGVSIKADCTRVRRHLGINVRGQFELSHLYKLVKYSQSNPKLVNKRLVNLSLQVEEHLGLPLYKEDDVRCSDWSRRLDYRQVQYAAADPYACLRLYHVMEAKRKALNPVPPRPAFVELDLPIRLANGEPVPRTREDSQEPEPVRERDAC
ncbi:hypothetical protein VTN77DRAFT_1716 [Rasamsonia byssochlamydoides]|uniref:uncharacterized protein n=1 Tax=Rasamsonia byssochlamydoides TaxID=89139 RepID=UPI00374263C0